MNSARLKASESRMIKLSAAFVFLFSISCIHGCIERRRKSECELSDATKEGFSRYFSGMRNIYDDMYGITGLETRKDCGWKSANLPQSSKKLPSFIVSVGLEGAGHHLYSELFQTPVFDCVWVNFFFYFF
jgi:hypothetical protein